MWHFWRQLHWWPFEKLPPEYLVKSKFVYHRKFQNREAAKIEIFRYIEGFYHPKRIHSSIGYRTPNEMELLHRPNEKLVA
ncbi:IS3 family transposase [Flavobacterium notoginsengisoli]|uniref:IS3 family transposase n=1 Tax=Flavobacterium notoginsengisoli TaxID=1478199 RepID=UPI00362F3BFF